MSVIDNLKPKSKTASAEMIRQQLAEAESERASHAALFDVAALQVVNGLAGAESQIEGIKAKMRLADERIQLLRSALVAAEQQEKASISREQKQIQKANYKAMEKAIAERDAAAAEVVQLSGKLAKAYRALHAASIEAMRCTPNGMKFPAGTNFEEGPIMALVQRQFWKVSAKPSNRDRLAIPAAAPGDLAYVDDPSRPDPLDVSIRKDSVHVLAALKPAD